MGQDVKHLDVRAEVDGQDVKTVLEQMNDGHIQLIAALPMQVHASNACLVYT